MLQQLEMNQHLPSKNDTTKCACIQCQQNDWPSGYDSQHLLIFTASLRLNGKSMTSLKCSYTFAHPVWPSLQSLENTKDTRKVVLIHVNADNETMEWVHLTSKRLISMMQWWYFNLNFQKNRSELLLNQLSILDDLQLLHVVPKTSKFRICCKSFPTRFVWMFFCLPPLAAKKSCTPSLWTESENCSKSPFTIMAGREFIAPIPGETQKKTVLEMFCTPHLLRLLDIFKEHFKQNYELDMSLLNILKRKTFFLKGLLHQKRISNHHVLMRLCIQQHLTFPPVSQAAATQNGHGSVATHGCYVEMGTNMVQQWILEENPSSPKQLWFTRHLLRSSTCAIIRWMKKTSALLCLFDLRTSIVKIM